MRRREGIQEREGRGGRIPSHLHILTPSHHHILTLMSFKCGDELESCCVQLQNIYLTTVVRNKCILTSRIISVYIC